MVSETIQTNMNDFPKTAAALRELRAACRQLACANLRSRLMLDELYALSPADKDGFARVVEKFEKRVDKP